MWPSGQTIATKLGLTSLKCFTFFGISRSFIKIILFCEHRNWQHWLRNLALCYLQILAISWFLTMQICSIFSLCGRLSPFSKLSGALFYLKNVQCKRCNPCSLASFLQIKSFEDSQSILKILQCAKSSQAFASLSFSVASLLLQDFCFMIELLRSRWFFWRRTILKRRPSAKKKSTSLD